MSNDVQFNDYHPSQEYTPRQKPKMVRWVLKIGLAKDEKQANYILLGVVALAIVISLFLVFGGGGEKDTFAPPAIAPPSEVIPPAKF